MIQMKLKQIAEIVKGTVHGDSELEINGVEIDSRIIRPGQLFVPIKGERVNGHQYVSGLPEKGVCASFWLKGEEGMPDDVSCIVVDNVETALTELASSYRKMLKGKVIGVTGSAGKTSTKDMIASVLSYGHKVTKTSGNQNNDLGIPRTLLAADVDDDYVIVEMGIDHMGEMIGYVDIVQPDMTAISSIAPAHMMNFHSLDNIVLEKTTINARLGDGKCFYNHDAYGLAKQIRSQKLNQPIGYGYGRDCDVRILNYQLTDEGSSFTLSCFPGSVFTAPVLGENLSANLTVAILIGRYEGMTVAELQEAVKHVTITEHRLQIRRINGATVLDDAYNSNPGSLRSAVQLLAAMKGDNGKITVLGDMLELGETSPELHRSIADAVDFALFENTLLYGPEMKNLYDELVSRNIAVQHFDDYNELKAAVEPYVREGKTVLFKASNSMKFIPLIAELEEKYEN